MRLFLTLILMAAAILPAVVRLVRLWRSGEEKRRLELVGILLVSLTAFGVTWWLYCVDILY